MPSVSTVSTAAGGRPPPRCLLAITSICAGVC